MVVTSVTALCEAFSAHAPEYNKFERVEAPRSRRPDLHAFLLLDSLVPKGTDIVVAAGHDEIWLGVELEALVDAGIRVDQVIELQRCGVRLSEGGLAMFV